MRTNRSLAFEARRCYGSLRAFDKIHTVACARARAPGDDEFCDYHRVEAQKKARERAMKNTKRKR